MRHYKKGLFCVSFAFLISDLEKLLRACNFFDLQAMVQECSHNENHHHSQVKEIILGLRRASASCTIIARLGVISCLRGRRRYYLAIAALVISRILPPRLVVISITSQARIGLSPARTIESRPSKASSSRSPSR